MNGKGFIVIDPGTFQAEEHETLDEANDQAAFLAARAHGSGRAIIYMPVATVRPNIASTARIAPADILRQAQALTSGHVKGQVARLEQPELARLASGDDVASEVSSDPNDKS